MTFSDWRKSAGAAPHQSTRDEIRALLGVADRDLRDSDVSGLSPDSQLGLAYNAALQLATAALAASGFRVAREAKHLRTIESLAYTIRLDASAIRRLDAFRRKRNVSDYERAGATSEREAGEMKRLARELRTKVLAWLKANHATLL